LALNSTIQKIELSLADLDQHRYADYSLTIAQHPSETAERVMVRVFAYSMLARDGLSFGRGLSTDDDPDLQVTDLTGAMSLAALVGLPEEKAVRQFAGRADEVYIFAYGGAKQDVWWRRSQAGLRKIGNLTVLSLAAAQTEALAGLLNRSVHLSVTVQDDEYLFSCSDGIATVNPQRLLAPANPRPR